MPDDPAVTVVLLGPIASVALALADNVAELGRAASALVKNGLPDAPSWLASLPLIGQAIHDYWQQFAHHSHKLIWPCRTRHSASRRAQTTANSID